MNAKDKPGQAWMEILGRKSPEDFAAAFAADVLLEAAVIDGPIRGASAIRIVFAATAAIYESLAFTGETTVGPKTFLEWEGRALGGLSVAGVTVLTRNNVGAIESVHLHHRQLNAVLKFSAELARRLEGKPLV